MAFRWGTQWFRKVWPTGERPRAFAKKQDVLLGTHLPLERETLTRPPSPAKSTMTYSLPREDQ